MAWSESLYGFLTTTQVAPGFIFNFDVIINENYPGIQFKGTEPNSVYQEIREISGDFWLVTNATWNGIHFLPVSSTVACYALQLCGPSNATTPGYIIRGVSAAGLSPCNFTTVFSVSPTGKIFGTLSSQQQATLTTQYFDGTVNTITFATAFPTSLDYIGITVQDSSEQYQIGTPQVISSSASFVTYYVAGAPTGTTGSIFY
ncbi:MAG: hypothetical protein ACREQ5_13745, partial [Candidatus Dormibacteria bacterium]